METGRRGFLGGLIAFAFTPRLISHVDPLNEISHLSGVGEVMAEVANPYLPTMADLVAAIKKAYPSDAFHSLLVQESPFRRAIVR